MAQARSNDSERKAVHSPVTNDFIDAKSAFSRRYFTQHWQALQRASHGSLHRAQDIQTQPHHPHGIGVGHKLVGSKTEEIPCVRFYVSRKLPLSVLPHRFRIPKTIDGLPTDVIEAAPSFLAAAPACSFARRSLSRPIQGGISVANVDNLAGTLGVVCQSSRPAEAGQHFLLSNRHVMASVVVGSETIVQPSVADGGVLANRIAVYSRGVDIKEGEDSDNAIDAAIALLDAGIESGSAICSLGDLQGTTVAVLQTVVHKHGRTTGYTMGLIDDISVDTVIPLSREDPTRVARFLGQVRIRPRINNSIFAQSGDSGAIVASKSNNAAIGLLFACPDNGSYAYANPINAVLSALEINWLVK